MIMEALSMEAAMGAESAKPTRQMKPKTYLAIFGGLAFAVGATSADAQQFPYREPGPYRTAFVESSTKTCIRGNVDSLQNAAVSIDVITRFCECRATVMATLLTTQVVEEAAQGGMHMTPRFRVLEETAEASCLKMLTGR